MYTLKQASEKLGISIVTLRRYIKQGKLLATKVGKEYRVAEEDVEALLSSSRPANPEEMTEKALETNEEFRYTHMRADLLRKAEKQFRDLGEIAKADEVAQDALVFDYRLIVQARAEKRGGSNRGRFSPRMTGKNAEGNDAAWPDPALITEELVTHAKKRADSLKNPVTKAVYADLVYEYSRNADKPLYGRRAAEYYLDAANIEPDDKENFRYFNVQDHVLRALEITLALKDATLLRKVVKAALERIKTYSSEGKPRIIFEIAKELLKNHKKLEATDLTEVDSLIESAVAYYFNEENQHLGRGFLELRKMLPYVKASTEEQKKIQRRLFESFMQEGAAKADSGMVAAHFYSEALKVGNGVLTADEQKALRRKIEEANLQGEKEMQEHAFEFTIKNEDIKKYVNAVLVDDLEKSLVRVALLPGMIPSLAHAEKSAKEMLEKYPVSHMFSTESVQDGRVIAITGGGLEISEDHIMARLSEEIQTHGLFLGFLFDELKKRGLDAQKLAAYLSQRDFFKNDCLPAISEAVSLYFDGKYYSAVTVLLMQFEQLLRLANRKIGLPTLRSLDSGEQRVIYLQEALESLKGILDAFSPDAYPYFCLVLWDKRGLGLRDTAAHGLLEYSSANKNQANLLLQLLLVLALFEYKGKDDENNVGKEIVNNG